MLRSSLTQLHCRIMGLPLRAALGEGLRYCCRTTCSLSFRPESTSVFTPFEMPMLTAIFFMPSLALGLGMSTDAFLSLSYRMARFRNHQHIVMLVQNDLGVGGHLGFQFAAGIVDGNTHFESRHIVFLDAHGRDLGDMTGKGLVLEGLHANARRLSQIHLADIALIYLTLDVNLAGIAQRHDQRSARAQHQDGAHRIANFHVTRQHHAVDRRSDGRIAELLFELLQAGLDLFQPGPAPAPPSLC